MSGRPATVVAILILILAACSAGVEPTPSPTVSPTPSHGPSSPATVSPAPTAIAPSPTALGTPTPTPQPTPTPKPTPPRPTGVTLDWQSLSFCDQGLCETYGWQYIVRWKMPRAMGIQIRVYAVTSCLAEDVYGVIDGWCLRESTANDIYGTEVNGLPARDHGALPSSMLKLLAKAPASKGKVTWRLNDEGVLNGHMEGAAYYEGPQFYAVVLVARDAEGGQSPFTIAYATHICEFFEDMECPDDADWPPDDGE